MPEKKNDIIHEAAQVPIEAVKTTLQVEKEGLKVIEKTAEKEGKIARDFWHGLGPGLTTGAADDDPSGIGTYSQQGSQFGFQLIWLSLYTFPLMAIVQETCARIGLATGQGLAKNIKKYFPKWVLIFCAILLLAANSFNIGADLGAMSKATELLAPWLPFWLLVFSFTLISVLLIVFVPYQRYARYLKYLALTLLVYVITAFFVDMPWRELLKHTIIPSFSFSREQIILVTGILGTTISPYLFFWETSQEVEEEVADGKTTIAKRQASDTGAIKKMRLDVWTGMFFSNLVMFFIVAVCGATLFKNGIFNIQTAEQAAEALIPLAGNKASLLFSIGIVATGLLAVPILASSASYALTESFGRREGLNLKFRKAKFFYGIIIFSMIVGLAMNFIGLDPVKALIYAAILNGLVAPVILVIIMILSNKKEIMGEHISGFFSKYLGWLITIIMILSGLATIYFLIRG